MWNKKTVSIVFPTYNEEKSVKNAINDFLSLKEVDEVIAIDNNSTDNSAREIKKTKAKYFLEKRQGYGAALIRGLNEASGYYVIMVEPDGSFIAKDALIFLKKAESYDLVLGTRTNPNYIQKGAKMGAFLRIGNQFLAWMMNILYSGQNVSDVGCTYKLIKRPALNKVLSKLNVYNSTFSPFFVITCKKHGFSDTEIPVVYKERIGNSKITSDFWKSFKLGIQMIGLILSMRFKN
ncbi:glycosyltransferase family 2 protein [archaeon]|nr:glycosyltransferase family 2 protein [archaeon]